MIVAMLLGVAAVLAGIVGTTTAFGVVGRATRVWPREFTESDRELFWSAVVAIRLVSLLLVATGVALVWLAAS